MRHKIWLMPEVFELLWRDARNYVVSAPIVGIRAGDSVSIEEGNEFGSRTGRAVEARVTAVSDAGTEGLPPGLCVFGVSITSKRSQVYGGASGNG